MRSDSAPMYRALFESYALKPDSVNHGAIDLEALMSGRLVEVIRNARGNYRLYRIGDSVAGRNVHAAMFDAFRICSRL